MDKIDIHNGQGLDAAAVNGGNTMAIKGIIFDYGGTLDTCGRHWGRVLWQSYVDNAVGVTEQQFRDAYVYVERKLGSSNIIRPDFTFRKTLEVKLRLELEYLADNGALTVAGDVRERLLMAMLNDVYGKAKAQTAESRKVLERLAERYPLVLVSNFYGNIGVVLHEFGFDGLFVKVIESAEVGVRKPDPRIFTLGVEALGLRPGETLVVGDSYGNDIEPAKRAGCHAVWLKGEGWTDDRHDESLPDAVITDLGQLELNVLR